MDATYRIELRIDGNLIGDVSQLAQNLTWRKCRTNSGVDEINFTLNDREFADWCAERNCDIQTVLKPYALDARIVRNGEAVIGGFMATMPAYAPKNDSADLALRFDGYLNLLAGVYLHPTQMVQMPAGQMVQSWITIAETRSANAGKAFGITAGSIQNLATVQRTIENFKPVKEAITDMTDNVEGAGEFDVIFNADRSYFITNQLGREIFTWRLTYPAGINGQRIATISASEAQGFASHMITIGSGEVSQDPDKMTAIVIESTDSDAVQEFGYVERLNTYSSISRQNTLTTRNATDLANSVKQSRWLPEITLLGRQVAPSPTAEFGLWIGDTIWIENEADLTGQTSGKFRIQTIEVTRSATGAETVKPKLERVA